VSILGEWANNTVRQNEAAREIERAVARQIFRDTRGEKADPETEPDFWQACLEMAREEIARDYFDLDQQERTGAPYPEGD
jgi:hypothetical protein